MPSDKLYDLLMRIPIVSLTLFFVAREFNALRTTVGLHPYLDYDVAFLLNIAARVSVIQFLLLLGFFHLTRRRPTAARFHQLRGDHQRSMRSPSRPLVGDAAEKLSHLSHHAKPLPDRAPRTLAAHAV